MKFIKKCIKCNLEMVFEKKDIKPLDKVAKKQIKYFKDMLNEKKEISSFLGKKQLVDKYPKLKKFGITYVKPFGLLTCEACKTTIILDVSN